MKTIQNAEKLFSSIHIVYIYRLNIPVTTPIVTVTFNIFSYNLFIDILLFYFLATSSCSLIF